MNMIRVVNHFFASSKFSSLKAIFLLAACICNPPASSVEEKFLLLLLLLLFEKIAHSCCFAIEFSVVHDDLNFDLVSRGSFHLTILAFYA